MNKTIRNVFAAFVGLALFAIQASASPLSPTGGPSSSIGAAKTPIAVTLEPNGSYDVTYAVVVENLGTFALSNVQLTDDLTATFPLPVTFQVVAGPQTNGVVAGNPAFNGITNINLLAPGQTLTPGQKDTIIFVVNVNVGNTPGIFFNQVEAEGTDQQQVTVTDLSDFGFEPDPNNDNLANGAGENDPTPVTLGITNSTVIGIAKAMIDTSLVGCTHNITYLIRVRNYGTEDLDNVSVTDNLAQAFPAPATYTISTVTASNPSFAINSGFNGNSDVNVLNAANSTLGAGQTVDIQFTVSIDFAGQCGLFENQVVATAQGVQTNTQTTDLSDFGTNPDTDADGNPNEQAQGENNATPYFVPCAVAGLAKEATAQLNPDGTYNVTYTVYVCNSGDADIANVVVTDDLSQTFPAPTIVTLVGNPTTIVGNAIPNLGFGTNNNWVLTQENNIPQGSPCAQIQFTINVDLNNTTDTLFLNTAIASGDAGCGQTFADSSTTGSNPDPSGNILPSDPGEATPTPIVLLPTISLIYSTISANADGINDVFLITNIGGKKVDLEIYNRWGAMVYKNENYDNSFNGVANQGVLLGSDLPAGPYWYIVKIDDGKEVKEFTGSSTITR